MIEVRGLTKRYGDKTAVSDLSFTVHPGRVTGFLGPNGAGKSTTMRVIMGLDRPTAGSATILGRPFRELDAPLRRIGALLEARAVHPRRSARNHLRWLATTTGIGPRRLDEVLELVGLTGAQGKPAGGFSLGMGQRLGLAAALLGDPEVVMLDEPVNGLDPEGIHWIRGIMRGLATEGRTVFVSSHLMSEMALTADHLVVIGRGRLVADKPLDDFVTTASEATVRVRTDEPERLTRLLAGPQVSIVSEADGLLSVQGVDAQAIARTALGEQVLITELTPVRASLETAFLTLTGDDVEYRAQTRTDDTQGQSA